MKDIADPDGRSQAIEAAGFQFIPPATAMRQLESLDLSPLDVTDIILTHCDPDHAGGLSDFPNSTVHISAEEKQNLDSGNPRYSSAQFSHEPNWVVYETNDSEFLGLPSRQVHTGLSVDVRLIPLFGHTKRHCGVAVHTGNKWILHVGDAYYLRDELTNLSHPIDELATLRADNNDLRVSSLNTLRAIAGRAVDLEVSFFGYHDTGELPMGIPSLEELV